MNVNGGVTCTMTEAAGYARKYDGDQLISGIWSHAISWSFEYNEDDVLEAAPLPKLKQWNPVGMISQLPACRLDYRGKGPSGGRKCPRGYIGAAHRHMRHGESVRVYFHIGNDAILMRPRRLTQ